MEHSVNSGRSGRGAKPRLPNEYINERPGRIPQLNYAHKHLRDITPEMIEGLALQNPSVKIKVKDIIGIGNNRSNHYDHNWNLLPMDEVPPELQKKHAAIIAKIEFHTNRFSKIQTPLAIRKAILNTVFEGDSERALQLPSGEYMIVGGADRMHFVKNYDLSEINAHVIKLEDLMGLI